jgi:hypothetical protein
MRAETAVFDVAVMKITELKRCPWLCVAFMRACYAVRLAPRTTVVTDLDSAAGLLCSVRVRSSKRSALPPNHVVHLKCGRKNNKSGRMFNVSD